MSEISKEIGQNIRRTRKMRKITHQQLAQAIGKSQSAISKYESGEIAVDIDTLYAIANALQVHIETLLYFPNTATSSSTLKECPAFFRNVKNLYGYVYDGRINRIGRRLFELHPEENGLTKVMMYMNFEDYDHYQNCENTYKGYMEHFDAVTNITLQNRDVEMETAYIQILAPTLNAETKWALFTGLSTRPIMPIARKLLLSKNRLCENKELENQLKVSKEDIKQLKLYHMYSVT